MVSAGTRAISNELLAANHKSELSWQESFSIIVKLLTAHSTFESGYQYRFVTSLKRLQHDAANTPVQARRIVLSCSADLTLKLASNFCGTLKNPLTIDVVGSITFPAEPTALLISKPQSVRAMLIYSDFSAT